MDKFLALGMSLDEVILLSTWHPAKKPARGVGQSFLDHRRCCGSSLPTGKFGFLDQLHARMDGTQKLCASYSGDGKVVYRSQRHHS